jgi:hypothetical protein
MVIDEISIAQVIREYFLNKLIFLYKINWSDLCVTREEKHVIINEQL